MKNRILKNIEWMILICVFVLIGIGCTALYSATLNSGGDELIKQLIWLAFSIPIMIIIIFIDYEAIAKISPILYFGMIISLICVLFTNPINGATSWFNIGPASIQPSEFAKIVVVITIAYIITKIQKNGKKEISNPMKLFGVLIILVFPIFFIIMQPDYGTAASFIIATILMLFVAELDKKYIIIAIIISAILIPVIYLNVLPSHAKTRIDVYLNPEIDPRGTGYNIIQSKLAIGSGQLFGSGFTRGNQTQLGFLYPKTTDFIFSVIGEEFGFIVSSGVIVLYIILITRGVYIAKTAKDNLGSYIAIGITGIFLFHMIENIGMTMGLLPITGVPLPFVSYGGSSLLTNLVLIGLLLNISGRRKRVIFK
ncbi:MAG TPA: rod shape-determining protein RodA [Clostridia bacterium]|nr:rod shape-determining protein RodA [Clostridia bacterium]